MTEKPKTPAQSFNVPGSLRIERFRQREGPSPVWIIWTPGTTRPVSGSDQQAFRDILKAAKWPASTPTGQKLREWLAEWGYVRQKKTVTAEPKVTEKGITTELDVEPEIGPTKMIT